MSHLALSTMLLVATAVPSAGGRGDTVVAIDVQGNDRTARDVVISALGVRPGDRLGDESLAALRQRVLNLRLFQEVEVTKSAAEAGAVISVVVKERWTLIPIPIVGASDGATQAGVAVLETNLFGRRKLLAVSGVYSSRGQSGFLFYRDPSLFGSRFVAAAEVVAENEVRERSEGFEVVQAWRDRRVDASVRPGFQLTPRLALRAGPFLAFRESAAEESEPAPPPAGTELGVAADLQYDGQDYRDWFNAGPFVHMSVRRSVPALGSARSFGQSTTQLVWSVPIGNHHAASASASAYLADGDPLLDAFWLGGGVGSRGLRTEGLWAERAVTSTLDYQVPVWRPRWGTLTAIGFVDAGVARWLGQRTRWIAPGGGFRVYVRNVALPALGLDLAWSSAGETLATSFFVGFR